MYHSLKIGQQILNQIQNKESFYPPYEDVFNAFKYTSKKELKVIFLGQDPYHDDFQAHGLSFSVKEGIKAPPSLKNILKLLELDLGIKRTSTDLTGWAKEGILLLNTALTVKPHQPKSHVTLWKPFLNALLEELYSNDYLIWVLLGNEAKDIIPKINKAHTILQTVHPSPLSAYRGFFESQLFTKINHSLKHHELKPIDFSRLD